MNIMLALRKETGLSQSKFAKLTRIPVRTLQSWEQGYRMPLEYVIFLLGKFLVNEGYLTQLRLKVLLNGCSDDK